MGGRLGTSSRRQLDRLLRRAGASRASPPTTLEQWNVLLAHAEALLSDLEKDSYLLERSLETSSAEMSDLNAELRDGAARLEAEREELRHANSVLQATLDSTTDAILVLSNSGEITSYNGRFAEMWGIPLNSEIVAIDSAAMSRLAEMMVDPAAFDATMKELRRAPGATSHDLVRLKDGRVIERDSLPHLIEGKIVGRVWSFRDVTDQLELQDELAHQAFHDSLTNLANRALFREHMEQAIRRQAREGGYVAVLVADLDGFKTVNDSLGHPVGDALLVAVADRLRGALREIDTISRLGGDEFAMVIEGLGSPELVARLGERIVSAMAQPFVIDGRDVAIGVSVGIATASGAVANPESLLASADTAMYRAKRDGKNCYRLFESWMHSKAVERLEIEQLLRTAVRDGTLAVHYQPVVDATTGRVDSFEALARWRPSGRAPVAPDVFIPIAEECGLINDIGRFVLQAACHEARRWQNRTPHLRPSVAVNVSQRQLVDPLFAVDVADALADAGIAPTSLVLEVTESVLGHNPTLVVSVLNELRATGVRVAIDDFGTGYSSLAALVDLPVDALKIDKRFVDNILDHGWGRGLVEAIVHLAGTLGLDTTAEGVEDAAQLQALLAIGCDRIQGYLYSKPLDADDTLAYLDAVDARELTYVAR